MSDLKILIVALNPLARMGLAALLAGQQGIAIAGQTAGGINLSDEIDLYRPDAFPASELPSEVGSAVHAPGGHVRVELKGQPLELNFDSSRETLDSAGQAPLGEVAPGADEVRGDADLDRHGAGGSQNSVKPL